MIEDQSEIELFQRCEERAEDYRSRRTWAGYRVAGFSGTRTPELWKIAREHNWQAHMRYAVERELETRERLGRPA